MVSNPGGTPTPVGVWTQAHEGVAAQPSRTGRPRVWCGGKGTHTSRGTLAFRPGWHLSEIPYAPQFMVKNPETGKRDRMPPELVWAVCEYASDVDYQEEAMSYGYTPSGKFRHAWAGLPRVPVNGFYRYRTSPRPDTPVWIISGAIRVLRILREEEVEEIIRKCGEG